jgi:phosphonoacetate hydrolase
MINTGRLYLRFYLSIIVVFGIIGNSSKVSAQPNLTQRIIIIMLDGFGEAYYRNSNMPLLNGLEKKGIYKVVPSLMPSVTNLNNASICTGELPSAHGITGNSFYDRTSSTEEFMEDSALLLAPTIFERAALKGVRSMLISSKKKTTTLLNKGVQEAISPETSSAEWKMRLGTPPDIYSREVNYWVMEAALYCIKNDSGLGIIYIHTTDYPMHTWPPESMESKEHLAKIDDYIGKIISAAPDAMILITADHTVNHKDMCLDLQKACAEKKTPVKLALSAERDRYFKHHRGFGGTSYVYLLQPSDLKAVKKTLKGLNGVEEVLSRKEAAKKFHLMPERIGDLVVLGNSKTVFGDLDTSYEILPANYRSHGSIYEANVPVFIYNAHHAPPASYFSSNYKIASWLYR